MGVHGEHDMWGVPRPLHLRGAPREAERLVVHLRGSWGVALERRLVFAQLFAHQVSLRGAG